MIPAPAPAKLGTIELLHDGPLVAGMRTQIRFRYRVGAGGLRSGSRLRLGLPNTGWERPVVPQQRYWDELVTGADRRLAPFHCVNTTATIESSQPAVVAMDVMERMLVPDEDPAFAYWRWWITVTLEAADLRPHDTLTILYGDDRLGSGGAQIQSFPEQGINVAAYVDEGGHGEFLALANSPIYFDVGSGPAVRANVVCPSIRTSATVTARVALTDRCHGRPADSPLPSLTIRMVSESPHVVEAVAREGVVWGRSNPAVPLASDKRQLFWGDLHAQSEHHVMHSQTKDFRQETWSKGISVGTLDECYQYAREVSLLDFVAITDQGACLTRAWEHCQAKAREYHVPGHFVTFKAYEAGSPVGHRNIFYRGDEIEPPFDAEKFNFHPETIFRIYRGRDDVISIPHHVKTWTDWQYHDPALEPLMEIYSCWGQSESPGTDLWDKGQTPGAGAWEAFRRGYRLGMIASTDNHVGMPGRSFPGDRQAHTPFAGGLCAIWAEELTRESLFRALRARRCYGTTGARIIVRFRMAGEPMGSVVTAGGHAHRAEIEVHGTAPLDRVEVVRDLQVWKTFRPNEADQSSLQTTWDEPATGCYYLRVFQTDGQRAWSSPIWVEGGES